MLLLEGKENNLHKQFIVLLFLFRLFLYAFFVYYFCQPAMVRSFCYFIIVIYCFCPVHIHTDAVLQTDLICVIILNMKKLACNIPDSMGVVRKT